MGVEDPFVAARILDHFACITLSMEDPFVPARILVHLDRFACITLSTVAYSVYTKVVEPVYVVWEDSSIEVVAKGGARVGCKVCEESCLGGRGERNLKEVMVWPYWKRRKKSKATEPV